MEMLLSFDHEKNHTPSATVDAIVAPRDFGLVAQAENNEGDEEGQRIQQSVASPTALEESEKIDAVPQLGHGAGGLWGSPRPPDDAERLRDMSSAKRRWTVNERA